MFLNFIELAGGKYQGTVRETQNLLLVFQTINGSLKATFNNIKILPKSFSINMYLKTGTK